VFFFLNPTFTPFVWKKNYFIQLNIYIHTIAIQAENKNQQINQNGL